MRVSPLWVASARMDRGTAWRSGRACGAGRRTGRRWARNIWWPAPADGGRGVRRRTGGDRTTSSSPTAPTPATGGTPWTGTPPSRRSSRRCAVGAGGGRGARQERRDCGWRPSRWSAAMTARRRPRSRSSRPCTRSTRTRRAATTQRPSTPCGSGGFPGGRPAPASGGFHEVEPYASSGFRWPVVAPSASGGHRAVSADLHTWGGEPRAQRQGSLGRVSSDARQRRVGRSLRPGLVRPARGPAVADGDDGCVVPGGLLDAAPAGDRHGPPPPPSGPGRLVTASRYVAGASGRVRRRESASCRPESARLSAHCPAHRDLRSRCRRGRSAPGVRPRMSRPRAMKASSSSFSSRVPECTSSAPASTTIHPRRSTSRRRAASASSLST